MHLVYKGLKMGVIYSKIKHKLVKKHIFITLKARKFRSKALFPELIVNKKYIKSFSRAQYVSFIKY